MYMYMCVCIHIYIYIYTYILLVNAAVGLVAPEWSPSRSVAPKRFPPRVRSRPGWNAAQFPRPQSRSVRSFRGVDNP